MINDKNALKSLTVIAIVFSVLAIVVVGTASAKSLYMVPDHHTSAFSAYNINPGGTVTYQATYTLTHSTDPSGIAIDESSNTLFISSEFSGGVEMVDATTLTILGVSTGPSNLGGLAADDANNIVYALRRQTNDLYAYDWNAAAKTLTLKTGYPVNLPNCGQGMGIALDETTGILWVADASNGKVRAYNVGTWTEDASKSFTPSHKPVDVAIDRIRGIIYTVSMKYEATLPSSTGSNYISKYDLATSTETRIDMGHVGVGIAVDEVTGYVYVTGGQNVANTLIDDSLEVWDPFTQAKLQDTDDIGNPAGICIPQAEVSYNPLGLTKDDGVSTCVNPGDTITYTMSYTNGNPTAVTGVTLTDTVPAQVTVTDTGGGTQSGNTVTWSIGTLTPGQSGSKTLTVTVNAGTPQGSTITNSVTINANEPNTGPTTVNEQTQVCGPSVPEFASIALPVASIFGLLFFNLRMRRKEEE